MAIKPAIIVVAFNRPMALKRLLDSLELANYPSEDIPMVISVDHENGGTKANAEVLQVAQSFRWNNGPKEVLSRKQNLGLRQHVLSCGDLTRIYGSLIMLEDDLRVSPSFYTYAREALLFSEGTDRIAGVSLYNHRLNVHTREDFLALEDGFDNWYLQFASSWGQAWTAAQWDRFRSWYNADGTIDPTLDIPANVRAWSEKSWLKYFIAFLIKKDAYFLYPRVSHTTNFSETGTHVGSDSTAFQVPLDYGHQTSYSFSSLKTSGAVYDAFYESTRIHTSLGMEQEELTVDLYGYRKGPWGKRYLLSSRAYPFAVLESYGRCMRPQEANVIEKIEGGELFLYDTKKAGTPPMEPDEVRRILYSIRHLNARQISRLRQWSRNKRFAYLKRKILRFK